MANEQYLNEQIITYLGNKRKIISRIEEILIDIKTELGKYKLTTVDLFSGSGVVARMMKSHSSKLIANDFEQYSYYINTCYLTNKKDFNQFKYDKCLEVINKELENLCDDGIIRNNYAPKDEENITEDDRVFYTIRNARIIDTIRKAIDKIPYYDYKKFFIAPLLYEASVHVNTSGVFKGFYKTKKDENGKQYGKYGGEGGNALERITGEIKLKQPIFCDSMCDVEVYCEDSNELVKNLEHVDVIYIDPPYNQHPYGSNYFMLNTIIDNKITGELSKVAGVPDNWKRSKYNKRVEIGGAFSELISNCNASYIIVSYNSDGFLSKDDIVEILSPYGDVTITEIDYPTFRGSRNLQDRDLRVTEYLFVLKKDESKKK